MDCEIPGSRASKRDLKEIIIVLIVILGVYYLLKWLNLLPSGLGVKEGMSLGFVFVLGLIAAVSSCMAITGGLLLGLAAKYQANHPNLKGYAKFKPYLYFNIGRVVGYAVFGALVGWLGGVLSFSLKATGFITIIASLAMIILGFNLLRLFPSLRRFSFSMPNSLAHKIYSLKEKDHKGIAFILGSLTFFLPCGFTQSLQLYVLSQGNAIQGGLIMLVFALGTLPALLSVSVLASFIKDNWQRYFIKFAGVLIILLGLFNISRGLALTGLPNISFTSNNKEVSQVQDANVQIINGRQVIKMKVVGYDYQPANFIVKANMPVDWEIDGSQAAGCARVITIPGLRRTEMLSSAIKTISFTPTLAGRMPFSCTMGMTTTGAAIMVVE